MLCIYGLSYLFNKSRRTLYISSGLIVTSFVFTTVYMIRNFPVQCVYFNEAFLFDSPEQLRKTFELDYWGISNKQSLEYILKHDLSPSIDIFIENDPQNITLDILAPSDRKRFKIVPKQNAKYFITNYRWHPDDYSEYAKFKFHSLLVEKNTVNEIFKLK